MVTKIKFCSEEFLISFKANFESEYFPLYISGNKEEILSIFNSAEVFEGDLEFNYKPLKLSSEVESQNDLFRENSKILYSMLKDLTVSQATREELWFTLLNTVFIDYLMDYISTVKDRTDAFKKIRNMFFNQGNKRSLYVNHLSKYWWTGHKTYDENKKLNPFWLTDFFTKDDAAGKAVLFFSSNINNNPNFALGITEAIKELVEEGIVLNRKDSYNYINKYFNFVGGVKVLDLMTRDQIREEAKAAMEDMIYKKIEIPLAERKLILGADSKYL